VTRFPLPAHRLDGIESPRAVTPFRVEDFDWVDVRDRISRRLGPKFSSRGQEFVEDLVSEAVFELLIAIQRQPAEHPHGLIARICETTERDAIRRLRRQALRVGSMPDDAELIAPSPSIEHEYDDPSYRVRWLVLTYFESRDAACQDIARERFAGKTLKQIAEERRRSHDALRQQWSRCVNDFRRAVADDEDQLWDWIHASE